MHGKLIKGQPHNLAYMTKEEMKAMNELRREPGLRGRLARKGAKRKFDYEDGVPAFYLEGTSYDYAPAAYEGSGLGSGSTAGEGGPSISQAQRIQRAFDKYKEGEGARNAAAAEQRLKDYRGEKRQTLVDKFGDFQGQYKDLQDSYDVTGERTSTLGLADEAKQLGAQYGTQTAGVRGDLSGYETDLSGTRTKIQDLATQALTPGSERYEANRGLLAGTAEAQRRAQNLGAMEQLNRGAAASGMSPEKLALARAQLKQGQGVQARQDALTSAMGAQQMTGQQISQGANLIGRGGDLTRGGANLALQRAGLLGSQAQMQSGLLGQRGGFQGLSADLAGKQAFGSADLLGQQVGMHQAQLQDVVAQQNQQFEKEMAEKGFDLQRQTAQMSRPQGPSTMDQMVQMAGAVAPFIAMSDRGLKKNIRSATDKDLLSPKEVDGFLDSLYAHQYNYKDGKHGKGKQVGVMAQDLEKTQLGRQMVEDTPEGKRVNYGKGLGLVVASQARINERLNQIGA